MAERKKRVPMNAYAKPFLDAEQREGYVRRWINDSAGRIEQAQNAGYNFVNDPTVEKTAADARPDKNETQDIGSRMSRIVGRDATGAPLRAYLMEQKEEYYVFDQKKKEERNAKVDEAILANSLDNQIEPGKRYHNISMGGRSSVSKPT